MRQLKTGSLPFFLLVITLLLATGHAKAAWFIAGEFQNWKHCDADYELKETSPDIFEIELPYLYGAFLIEAGEVGYPIWDDCIRSNGSKLIPGEPYSYVKGSYGEDIMIDSDVYDVTVTLDTIEQTLLMTGENLPTPPPGNDYNGWYVNVPGDFNNWEDNGVLCNAEGMAKLENLPLGKNGLSGKNGFKVKVWTVDSDVWLSNGSALPLDIWVSIPGNVDENMTIMGARENEYFDVEFNCATNEIRVTRTSMPYTFDYADPADHSKVSASVLKDIQTYWNSTDAGTHIDSEKPIRLLDVGDEQVAIGLMVKDSDNPSHYIITFDYESQIGAYTVVIPEGILVDGYGQAGNEEVRLHYTVVDETSYTATITIDPTPGNYDTLPTDFVFTIAGPVKVARNIVGGGNPMLVITPDGTSTQVNGTIVTTDSVSTVTCHLPESIPKGRNGNYTIRLRANSLNYTWSDGTRNKSVETDFIYKVGLQAGDEFEYEGLWYTVLDAEARTCETRAGTAQYDPESESDIPLTAGNEANDYLNIPSRVPFGGEEYTVTGIGKCGFAFQPISEVSLPWSLTAIGDFAFNQSGLLTVEVPPVNTLGEYAFAACQDLEIVRAYGNPTNIGDWAFAHCPNLMDVEFDDSMTTIGFGMFENCPKLEYAPITESMTTIQPQAFRNCTGLLSVSTNEFITEIGHHAFAGCTALRAADLPYSLKSLGQGAFAGCEALSRVDYYSDMPITAATNCFEPTTYANATLYMPAARMVDIEATEPWSLFEHVQARDGEKPEVIIEEFEYEGLWYRVLDREAMTCTTIWHSDAPEYVGDIVIPEVAVEGTNEYTVTEIGPMTFMGAQGLNSITFPETLRIIRNEAFEACTGLTALEIPASVTEIQETAFIGCESVTSIVIAEGAQLGIDATAFGCPSLKSLTLPASLRYIEGDAFNYCDELMEVTYGAEKPISAEWDCFSSATYADATLTMPNATMSDIDATEPWSLFEHVVAKDGIKPVPVADGDVFEYEGLWYRIVSVDNSTCEVINAPAGTQTYRGDIRVPESVPYVNDSTYAVLGISENAFRETNVETIVLPEGLGYVGTFAFGYSGLVEVQLPASIVSIGEGAFSGCENLHDVTYLATVPVETPITVFDEITYANATLTMSNATMASIEATEPWMLFEHVVARDGIKPVPVTIGDEFEYEGLWYRVTDTETMTCETRPGESGKAGNDVSGDLVIPAVVINGEYEFTVTRISDYAFTSSPDLFSVTMPASVVEVGSDALSECPRLTSLVWHAPNRLTDKVTASIGNPNLLVYVDEAQYAPASMNRNVVTLNRNNGDWTCAELVLEPGHPFRVSLPFKSLHSTMTKEFTQHTPVDGCGGWETIVLPFDATNVRVDDARGALTPFAAVTDIWRQYPYWLYEADATGEWKASTAIKAGVPYIISMPNNEEYEDRFNISGAVTFSTTRTVDITTETTAPYAVTWTSGREFRSLWMPLDEDEISQALGLNVGIEGLSDDNGQTLLPGSAFYYGVRPKPLEAYVTRLGAERVMRISREVSGILSANADSDLKVECRGGAILIHSGMDRHVEVFRIDGVRVAACDVTGGEPFRIEGLVNGIYVVAGRKVVVH